MNQTAAGTVAMTASSRAFCASKAASARVRPTADQVRSATSRNSATLASVHSARRGIGREEDLRPAGRTLSPARPERTNPQGGCMSGKIAGSEVRGSSRHVVDDDASVLPQLGDHGWPVIVQATPPTAPGPRPSFQPPSTGTVLAVRVGLGVADPRHAKMPTKQLTRRGLDRKRTGRVAQSAFQLEKKGGTTLAQHAPGRLGDGAEDAAHAAALVADGAVGEGEVALLGVAVAIQQQQLVVGPRRLAA